MTHETQEPPSQDAPSEVTVQPATVTDEAAAGEPMLFGNIPEEHVRAFVGRNADYYLEKFHDIETLRRDKRKLTLRQQFDLRAIRLTTFLVSLVFSPIYYLLYRRMYAYALSAIGLSFILGLLQGWTGVHSMLALHFALAALGLYANYLYYRFVRRKITKIYHQYYAIPDDDIVRRLRLRGGTQLAAPLVAYGLIALCVLVPTLLVLPTAMAEKGKRQLAKKEYAQALSSLDTAAALKPNDARIQYYRGLAATNLGQRAKAKSAFQAAVNNGVAEVGAYEHLAYMLLGEEKLGEAYDVAAKGLVKAPKSSRLHFARGRYWQNQGNLKPAMDDYDLGLKLDPKAPYGYFCRGSLFMQTGNAQAALEDLNTSIQLDPKYRKTYELRAKVWQQLGNEERAQEDLRMAKGAK